PLAERERGKRRQRSSLQRRYEAATVQTGRRRAVEEPRQVEQGRRDVDEPHLGPDAGSPGHARALRDERPVDQLVEERVPVRHAAVVRELLTVIRGDDDRGVRAAEAARAQLLDETSDGAIALPDLGVVAPDQIVQLSRLEEPPARAELLQATRVSRD